MLIGWEPGLVALRIGRGIDLAASLGLLGVLLFTLVVALPVVRARGLDHVRARLSRLTRGLLALKIAGFTMWLPAQALGMAGGGRGLAEVLPIVVTGTVFGRALLLRTALFVLAVFAAGRLVSAARVAVGTALAALALGMQARLGHAVAAGDAALPWIVALHVVAAGAWLGGLVPLALSLRAAPPDAAAEFARRFSAIGLVSVAVLIVTAWLQSPVLIGGPGGWFGTDYGIVALAKTVGFVLLLALAALNRVVFTPRIALRGGRAMVWSVAAETGLGLTVVLFAVVLATLPPGAHVQPVWPFAYQLDTAALEQPHVQRELRRAGILVAVAAAGIAALFWRRTRLAGPALALAALVWLPQPNLRLALQPASPSTFYRSETGYSVASIARGEEILRRHCTADCFRGYDDPSDLTPYNIWRRSDGDLFGWLTEVFDVIGHSPLPHDTIAGLSARARWQLIDYFRARVAGSAVHGRERWPYAVPAPAMPIECGSGPAALSALRGGLVHIAARGDGTATGLPAPVRGHDLTTVILSRQDTADPTPPGICLTTLPDAWTAYAIAGGLTPETLEGTDFIIDAEGLMRARILPGAFEDDDEWAIELRQIAETSLPRGHASAHGH